METTTDCLYRHVGHNFYFDLTTTQLKNIQEAMKSFAIQHLRELARQTCKAQHDRLNDKNEIRRMANELFKNLYPLTNIK